jgi:hypothetical protein
METNKATISDAAVLAVYGGLCYTLGFIAPKTNQPIAMCFAVAALLAPFLMVVILWAHKKFSKKKEIGQLEQAKTQ